MCIRDSLRKEKINLLADDDVENLRGEPGGTIQTEKQKIISMNLIGEASNLNTIHQLV